MVNCSSTDFYKIEEIRDLLEHMPFDVIARGTVTNPGKDNAIYNYEITTGLMLHTSGNSYSFSLETNHFNPISSVYKDPCTWAMSEKDLMQRDRVFKVLFDMSLSKMPLLINDETDVLRVIAAWRLRIGR